MRRLIPWRRRAEETTAAKPNASEQPPPASSSSIKKTFPSGIKLLHNPADPVVDIVFVHGLTGDREKTWTARDASEPWPKTLLPSEIPTARVLAFGYDAYVTDWRRVVSQSRIGDHAWNLLTSLATYRERDDTNERPIIFVCHSLGGLVCEDALVRSKERSERHLHNILRLTRGIAFLGTPHHGSSLARWAELLSRHIGVVKQINTEIVAVLKRESEVLARIQDSFHTMVIARNTGASERIHITCFFEELPLPGIGQVVPQNSAILPGYIPIGIRGNHMDITKFVNTDDPGFIAVCGELRRWVKDLGKAGNLLESPPATQQLASTWFLVPYLENKTFIEREVTLMEIHQGLQSASQSRVALFGLGGVGKTQLALAYTYWLRRTKPEVSVFWVHASNAEQFQQAYASIARECQVAGSDEPKADALSLVKTWLERKDRGRWLMVIDNADDTQLFFDSPVDSSKINGVSAHLGKLGRYIPECAHGSILITTRNKQAALSLARGNPPMKIAEMNDRESEKLLRTKLKESPSPCDMSTLSSRLEHLPLALVQAAAFIEANTITVSEYLQLLDKGDGHLADLLSEEFETVGRDSETPHAVTETWILSFEQIQRQNAFASELMSFMSLLNRQAIPLDFLSNYGGQQQAPELRGELQLTKALGVLKAFSFITDNKGSDFDMHRLVQLVTRKWLLEKGTLCQFAKRALLTVSQLYPYGSYENRIICGAYLSHAYAVLELEGTGSKDERLAKASLLHRAAGFFDYQGQWEDAEKFLEAAKEIRNEVLGPEHPSTLTSIANLASTYRNQGRWAEAESLFVQVMETRKRVLGSEHPSTLTSMANLASTYRNQGRWAEAESLFVQVMETSSRVLGSEHPSTLTSMANLASTYRNQGRWAEAESLFVQVMETRKRVLGSEHPSTLTSMNNLAFTWEGQGRLDDALELMRQCVRLRQKVLGPDHPYTQTSLSTLDRWQEASSHQDGTGEATTGRSSDGGM